MARITITKESPQDFWTIEFVTPDGDVQTVVHETIDEARQPLEVALQACLEWDQLNDKRVGVLQGIINELELDGDAETCEAARKLLAIYVGPTLMRNINVSPTPIATEPDPTTTDDDVPF